VNQLPWGGKQDTTRVHGSGLSNVAKSQPRELKKT